MDVTSLLHRRWFPAALVCFAVCLAHLQAPGAEEFHYDDGHSLVRNLHLRDLNNLPLFFADASLFGENPEDRMYRPLVLVTHSLNLAFSGLEPGGFVAVNLLIHALSAGLATWLLCLMLPPWTALAGGLLFGLHPLQSEVIHYASARSESMAGLFVILTLVAFVSSQRTGSRGWSSLAVVSAGLGLMCKATAIVAPALIFLISTRLYPSQSIGKSLRASAPFGALAMAYLLIHQSLTASTATQPLRSMGSQLLTQSKALIHYSMSAAMPVRLSIHPQFSQSTRLEPVEMATWAVILSLAVICWRLRPRTLWRGMGWFVACLSPTLAIPLNILVNDHRPYLAVAGLCWMVVELPRRVKTPLLAAVLCVFFILSWQRAPAWRTEQSIWRSAVQAGPQMAATHYNLGFAQHIAGQSDRSISHYREALRLDPDYVRPMNNLGALLREQGDLPAALKILQQAARLEPDGGEVLNNLGSVLIGLNRPLEAVPVLLRAAHLSPESGEIWLNLGLAQRDAGQRSEAMGSLQRALQLDPTLRQRVIPGGR